MTKRIQITDSISSAVKDSIEQKREERASGVEQEKGPVEGADDVLVSLGNLSDAKLADISFGKNYEAIAMDFIATFNGAVTQGVSPLKALMAMGQAFAIVSGQCIRAGLPLPVAQGIVKYAIAAMQQASNDVQIISKQ